MSIRENKVERAADPVLQFTDERLRQISVPVAEEEFDTPGLKDYSERLALSMRETGGVGIAAPQVGLFKRLVVIDIPAYERVGFGWVEAVPLHTLVNPEIVWFSEDKIKAAEGCLSVKGYEGFVIRPKRVGVVAYSPEGKRLEIEAGSLYARVLQHEIDHINGILYPDRVATLRDIRKIASIELNDPVLARNNLIPRPETSTLM